jgi:DNA modification methylase
MLFAGDSLQLGGRIPPGSVDAIITSPPYAQQRARQYGGVDEARYPEWTVGWLDSLAPALKPDASVAIVIRSHVRDGTLSDYVLRTRLAVRAAGWHEPDELIWMKPDAPPVGCVRYPRRSFEQILWFSRSRNPAVFPQANGTNSKRIGFAAAKGATQWLHQTAGSNHEVGQPRCRDYVEVPVSANARGNPHPAQFPKPLAEWLIKLFVPKGGSVLDPFGGSGTTAAAARALGRDWISAEIHWDYVVHTIDRLNILGRRHGGSHE